MPNMPKEGDICPAGAADAPWQKGKTREAFHDGNLSSPCAAGNAIRLLLWDGDLLLASLRVHQLQ
jgi:hypothetical protein